LATKLAYYQGRQYPTSRAAVRTLEDVHFFRLFAMSTTRSEQDQATQPVHSDSYQPDGRQEAPTNPDALYGGNADDNSGSGGNARPTKEPSVPATDDEGNPETGTENKGSIEGSSASSGTGSSGTSIGQVTL
jgi:hypothetical protein